MRLLDSVTEAHGEGRNDVGVDTISVRLVSHTPTEEALRGVSAMVEATWGQAADPDLVKRERMLEAWQNCLKKKELPAALEGINYTFVVDGVTRTCTHQLVRTRVGAAFGQQSQRANDISNFNVRIPQQVQDLMMDDPRVQRRVEKWLQESRELYSLLLDSEIPPQEARFFVPEGTQTHITCQYNTLALQGVQFRRLAAVMQWEIQWVARRMRDELLHIHPWVAATMLPPGEITGKFWNMEPMFYDASAEMYEWVKDTLAARNVNDSLVDHQVDDMVGEVLAQFVGFEPEDAPISYWFTPDVNPAYTWTAWDAVRRIQQERNPGKVFPLSSLPYISSAVDQFANLEAETV